MMIDTRIYGYVVDGAVFHPGCLPEEYGNPADNPMIGALFSYHDDDPHGLACDALDGYIFEPTEPHPFRHPPNQERIDVLMARCWDCGEYRDDEQLHPIDLLPASPIDLTAFTGAAERVEPYDPTWDWRL